MAKLAMLADMQRTVYPQEVTRQLHVMAQSRESSPVKYRRSNHCAMPPTKRFICVEWDFKPLLLTLIFYSRASPVDISTEGSEISK